MQIWSRALGKKKKECKKIVSSIHKSILCTKFECNMEWQTTPEWVKVLKHVGKHIGKTPGWSYSEKEEIINMYVIFLSGKDSICWWFTVTWPHNHHQSETTKFKTRRSRAKITTAWRKWVETRKCLYNNFNWIIMITETCLGYYYLFLYNKRRVILSLLRFQLY